MVTYRLKKYISLHSLGMCVKIKKSKKIAPSQPGADYPSVTEMTWPPMRLLFAARLSWLCQSNVFKKTKILMVDFVSNIWINSFFSGLR